MGGGALKDVMGLRNPLEDPGSQRKSRWASSFASEAPKISLVSRLDPACDVLPDRENSLAPMLQMKGISYSLGCSKSLGPLFDGVLHKLRRMMILGRLYERDPIF